MPIILVTVENPPPPRPALFAEALCWDEPDDSPPTPPTTPWLKKGKGVLKFQKPRVGKMQESDSGAEGHSTVALVRGILKRQSKYA